MSKIVVFGGTGYAGSNIVAEAASRGHEVISVSRSVPEAPVDGVKYVQGSVLDLDALRAELQDADVVVSALAPRGDMENAVLPALSELVARLHGTKTRIGVVGGAGGSLVAPGGPRLVDQDFPEEYKHETHVAIDSLELLQNSDASLDWFYIHPAEVFGSWVVGERTGSYRTGGDVVVRDENGKSFISGADFGIAVVDEIENHAHPRGRFTVGY